MKIIHFISGLQSGGVEQFLTNYTSRLNKNPDIQEYVVYQHAPISASLAKMKSAGNVCMRIPDKEHHPFQNIVETFKVISKIKPDIIHTHMNLVNCVPLFIAFLLGTPIRISHSHIANRNIHSRALAALLKFLTNVFATELFACGDYAGKYMYGNRRYEVIPNAIELSRFEFNAISRNKLRIRLGVPDTSVLIGNIGRLTTQKNQMFLLKTFTKALKVRPNIMLCILGAGELEDELVHWINQYNLSEYVRLIPPVANPSEYYSAFDVFALPSLYEGFPVVSVEAQAAGLPLLMSDTIDPTAKFLDSTKFLRLNDEDMWVSEIDSFVRVANRQSVNAKLDAFNIDIATQKLYAIYLDLFLKRGVA